MDKNLSDNAATSIPRLPLIDFMRGFALFTMAFYHFCWDLELFSLVAWPVANSLGWRFFAGLIAVTFLFFTGVSLTLAHINGIRWGPFLRRLAMVIAGAGAVSLSTWIYQPHSFVWFGILHCIAAAGFVGLLFLRRSPLITLAVAIAIILLPIAYKTPMLNNPYLAWIGLSTSYRFTVDYVPIFPWLGVTLVGIAFTKIGLKLGWEKTIANYAFEGPINNLVKFTGRHGLIFYLIHQPVLISLLSAALYIGIGSDTQTTVRFSKECEISCGTADRPECKATCACLIESIKTRNDWRVYLNNSNNPGYLSVLQDEFAACEKNN